MKIFTKILTALTVLSIAIVPRTYAAEVVGENGNYQLPDTAVNDGPKLSNGLRKSYWSTGVDGLILSSSLMKRNPTEDLTTLRFTGFFHLGYMYHYNFTTNFGLMVGPQIKNIGFIEQFGDYTIKRRVYTLGVPVGLNIGNIANRQYLTLGAGVDIALNYKVKTFLDGDKLYKDNEWFSKQNNLIMPYAFVGMATKVGTFKLNYYLNNFFASDAAMDDTNGTVPNYNIPDKVNLITLTFGFNISYKPRF